MKTIIIYKSSTGYTEKYANWLGKELNCKIITLKEAKKKELANYDRLIYGGGIRANVINGLKQFKKLVDGGKEIYIFAVGASENTPQVRDDIKKWNLVHIGDLPFYYFRGGMDLGIMRGAEKIMMNMIKSSLAKKETTLPQQDKDMLQMMLNPCDFSDRASLNPLIDRIKRGKA